jgi:hypothetical protein
VGGPKCGAHGLPSFGVNPSRPPPLHQPAGKLWPPVLKLLKYFMSRESVLPPPEIASTRPPVVPLQRPTIVATTVGLPGCRVALHSA